MTEPTNSTDGFLRGKVADACFLACAVFTLGAALLFGLLARSYEMGLAIVAGGIVMTFLRLDSIQLFKGLGFELRTLRQQVDKNAATIDQLRNLSIVLAKPIFGLLMGGGRYGGMAAADKIKRELDESLRKLDLTKEQLLEANSVYNAFRTWDHSFHIAKRLPRNLTAEEHARFNRLAQDHYNDLWIAPPADFRRELSAMGLLDDEAEEAVKDYEYFLDHRELRRSALWQAERSAR
jgi:hypothetical protein